MIVKKIWDKAASIGLAQSMSPSLARQVGLVNQLAILVVAMFTLSVVVNLVMGYLVFSGAQLLLSLGPLATFWFNHERRYLRAKVILLASGTLVIAVVYLMLGPGSALHLYLLPCLVATVIIFDTKEGKIAWWVAACIAAVLLILQLLPLPEQGLLPIPHARIVSSFQTSFVCSVLIILAVLYVMYRALATSEDQVEAQRAFQQAILDNIPVSIGVLDDEAKILFVNRQMVSDPKLKQAFIGSTEMEVRARLDLNVARGRYRQEKLAQALAERQAVEFEEVDDARHRVYWSIFTPIYDLADKLSIVINTRLDISELRRQETSVRQKENLFRAIFENTADALFLVDGATALIIDCNPAALQLFEYEDKRELMGINGDSLQVNPFTRNEVAKIRTRLNNDQRWDGELAYRTHKGREFMASVAITRSVFADKIVTIVRLADISQQLQAREMLLSAKEKAEEAVRAKSEFLSRMSHEIRTPLNAIVGLTNLMMQDFGAVSPENIATIKFSSDALLGIVNDILDFSKLEADKIEIESIPFSLHQVADQVVRSCQVTAQERGLYLHQAIDERLPGQLLGDPLRFQQILLNLVSNALKFTEKGGVDLQIGVIKIDNKTVYLKIVVADTGIGIPDTAKSTIFESFTQASAGTSRKFGGTGLGLAIVKRLVALMHGQVAVGDRPGGGSTFTITLPVNYIAQNQKTTSVENTPTSDHDLTGVRVLLAEDNKVNQFVAKQILGKWKVSVDVANHGQEAIDLLRANDYHIILMDIQMPIMDGIQAAQAIRQGDLPEPKRGIPIVALTADIMPDTKNSVLAAGMDDIIVKPFELDELYNLLKKFA
jgi:PAS domain S-box-containing protein